MLNYSVAELRIMFFSECKVIKKKEERQDFINKNFGNLRYFL